MHEGDILYRVKKGGEEHRTTVMGLCRGKKVQIVGSNTSYEGR